MNPPQMAGWNLALRLGLELTAIAGIALAAWRLTDGVTRWIVTLALPLVVAAAWGIFNVPGDPSRSGNAPVIVPGGIRLALELAILGAGAAALALRGPQAAGLVAALVVVHYAASIPRIAWLLDR